MVGQQQIQKNAVENAVTTTKLTTTSPSTTTAGGYSIVTNYQQDQGVTVALAFLKQTLGTRFSLLTIVRVLKQVVNGMNYQFIFDLQYTRTVVIKYAIVVYQPINGNLVISKQGFLDLPSLDFKTLRHFTVGRDIPYIEDISASLKLALKDQLQPYNSILEGDAS